MFCHIAEILVNIISCHDFLRLNYYDGNLVPISLLNFNDQNNFKICLLVRFIRLGQYLFDHFNH